MDPVRGRVRLNEWGRDFLATDVEGRALVAPGIIEAFDSNAVVGTLDRDLQVVAIDAVEIEVYIAAEGEKLAAATVTDKVLPELGVQRVLVRIGAAIKLIRAFATNDPVAAGAAKDEIVTATTIH
ncbi:MAG: hypothetical protein AAF713_20995 [Pseudomonadota bacterium]